MESIQEKALATYSNNLQYLKQNNKILFEKINLFDLALELNEVKERYSLEYIKEEYFDIYDSKEGLWIYNNNSEIYSSNIVQLLDLNATRNSFKTFYELKYNDDIIKQAKESSILSHSVIGVAPIIHYVNENLPKEEELKMIYNYLIFGVALGLHIPLIHKKIKAKIYHIVEPSLELFRLSLFLVNYSDIGKDSNLIFYISENKEEFSKRFKATYYQTFFYNHYIKFCMFSKSSNIYVEAIQNQLVSQSHYMYSYERELASFKLTYEYIQRGLNYINISKIHNFKTLKDKPVLIIAAGPSLRYEIEFIKKYQLMFIIVAVYATITFLEEHNIIPDIVVQYDQSDRAIDTLHNLKNNKFLSNTLFLFSSHITEKFLLELKNQNIFMYQALYKAKETFGSLTSPSIGEITYALVQILGFKSIYLLGLDMSLDPKTNQTHFSKDYFGSFSTDSVNEDSLENYSFRKSLIKVKGNFLPEVKTLPVYKVSLDQINIFTKKFLNANIKVYNLSNGAYFENTQPLKSEDIDISLFELLDKTFLRKDLKKCFNTISENIITADDIKYNEDKLRDAKIIKMKLEKFILYKQVSSDGFKTALHAFHAELCEEYKCDDLQKILSNYFNNVIHYIFYLFNLKEVSNNKKHVKHLQKLFYLQLNKIINEYIRIVEKYKNFDIK